MRQWLRKNDTELLRAAWVPIMCVSGNWFDILFSYTHTSGDRCSTSDDWFHALFCCCCDKVAHLLSIASLLLLLISLQLCVTAGVFWSCCRVKLMRSQRRSRTSLNERCSPNGLAPRRLTNLTPTSIMLRFTSYSFFSSNLSVFILLYVLILAVQLRMV